MATQRDQSRPEEKPAVRLEVRFIPGEVAVRTLRSMVRGMLEDQGFDSVDGVVLGMDEALMNACEHGNEATDHEIGLNILLFDDRLQLEVLDRGEHHEFDQSNGMELPDEESESGRGLFLIHQIMDEVVFLPREGGGTCVRLVKHR